VTTESQSTTTTAPQRAFRQTQTFSPGSYEATVVSAFVGKSPSGTNALWLNFNVVGMGQFQGTLWLSPKALPSTLEMLKKSFNLTGKEGFGKIPSLIKDKPCQIRLQIEQDSNGRDRLRLRFVNPPGFHAQPVDGDTLAELDALAAGIDGKTEEAEGSY
jgi:hypothetical protein